MTTNLSPTLYNYNESIRKAHNCYDYALNHYDRDQNRTSQPGLRYLKNTMPGDRYTCPDMEKRLKLDHPEIYKIGYEETCGRGEHKIAMVIDPDKDYHFLRQDSDGFWSHKPGKDPAITRDYSGKKIKIPHPDHADLYDEKSGLNYEVYCGSYCVREDDGHFAEAARASRERGGEPVPGWEFYMESDDVDEISETIRTF